MPTGYLLWGWAAPPAGAGGQDDYQPPPDDPAWQVLAFWSAAVSSG